MKRRAFLDKIRAGATAVGVTSPGKIGLEALAAPSGQNIAQARNLALFGLKKLFSALDMSRVRYEIGVDGLTCPQHILFQQESVASGVAASHAHYKTLEQEWLANIGQFTQTFGKVSWQEIKKSLSDNSEVGALPSYFNACSQGQHESHLRIARALDALKEQVRPLMDKYTEQGMSAMEVNHAFFDALKEHLRPHGQRDLSASAQEIADKVASLEDGSLYTLLDERLGQEVIAEKLRIKVRNENAQKRIARTHNETRHALSVDEKGQIFYDLSESKGDALEIAKTMNYLLGSRTRQEAFLIQREREERTATGHTTDKQVHFSSRHVFSMKLSEQELDALDKLIAEQGHLMRSLKVFDTLTTNFATSFRSAAEVSAANTGNHEALQLTAEKCEA